ncbi:MAG: T9SS type A sorting domain-containing protein, partial [Paludibacteraceae bacterium]|nr:T9SS type A sorting domain-containing protein [Paludibacteraceae bacterium]
FNNKKSMDYEIECDAAKFISNETPQIYSLDAQDVKYAINERPLSSGSVNLGYSVNEAGTYTIASSRMDCDVVLEDSSNGTLFDLSLGDYEFSSEAGTFDRRFIIHATQATTKLETSFAKAGVKVFSTLEGIRIEGAEQNEVRIFDTKGLLLQVISSSGLVLLPKAVYIVKVGELSTKIVVK